MVSGEPSFLPRDHLLTLLNVTDLVSIICKRSNFVSSPPLATVNHRNVLTRDLYFPNQAADSQGENSDGKTPGIGEIIYCVMRRPTVVFPGSPRIGARISKLSVGEGCSAERLRRVPGQRFRIAVQLLRLELRRVRVSWMETWRLLLDSNGILFWNSIVGLTYNGIVSGRGKRNFPRAKVWGSFQH